jgi:hypothetical protein
VLIVTGLVLASLPAQAGLRDRHRKDVGPPKRPFFECGSALKAALQLDGTDRGVARARQAASLLTSGPHAMKWDFGTQPITGIRMSFATGDTTPDAKTWQPESGGAGDAHSVGVVFS